MHLFSLGLMPLSYVSLIFSAAKMGRSTAHLDHLCKWSEWLNCHNLKYLFFVLVVKVILLSTSLIYVTIRLEGQENANVSQVLEIRNHLCTLLQGFFSLC